MGQDRIVLAGSGSSLAGPLLQVWGREFNRQQSAIQVSYVATSSTDGIRAMTQHVGDFAIGEVPLTKPQMQDPNLKLVEIPLAVVAVVPIYNLPTVGHLRFSGGLLAEIYMGAVSSWNDRRIAALNPSVILPQLPIVVVHRALGSGTRYIFTDFLTRSSPEFRAWIETPSGRESGHIIVAKSKDMVEKVALTPGTIGYVERSFATHSGLGYGSVQNRAGQFAEPLQASILAACESKSKLVSDGFPVSLVDASGEDSYPIVSFSWAEIPVSGQAQERKAAVREFLRWALQDGQRLMEGVDYYPLPSDLAERARARLRSLPR